MQSEHNTCTIYVYVSKSLLQDIAPISTHTHARTHARAHAHTHTHTQVEAMGGTASLEYQKFREHCYNAFLTLRR